MSITDSTERRMRLLRVLGFLTLMFNTKRTAVAIKPSLNNQCVTLGPIKVVRRMRKVIIIVDMGIGIPLYDFIALPLFWFDRVLK